MTPRVIAVGLNRRGPGARALSAGRKKVKKNRGVYGVKTGSPRKHRR